MSAVANGGILYRPTLITDTIPVLSGKIKAQPETLDIVKRALYGVVNEPGGTGWAAKSNLASICGKTGTAQVVAMRGISQNQSEKFRDHAWFVAFAPIENPEISLSVFVEHGGHGGATAAPIAKKAIEGYLKNLKVVHQQQNVTNRSQTD
jgi:penicillin-binding protein 2